VKDESAVACWLLAVGSGPCRQRRQSPRFVCRLITDGWMVDGLMGRGGVMCKGQRG
jgi:hypothetical protein